MKNFAIITTYPEEGSQNIGDALITSTLIKAIKTIISNDIKFNIIWRETNWSDMEKIIEKSDLIIFACLALRPRMEEKHYPALKNLIESKVPIAVISAGTGFFYESANIDFFKSFPEKTLNSIKSLSEKAISFTTRGVLTQAFCEYHNFKNVEFSGDIAYFDRRFSNLSFKSKKHHDIKKIAISDPHRPNLFLPLFNQLCNQLSIKFPQAEIVCLIHGKNDVIKNECRRNNIKSIEIFKNKDNGLDFYEEVDIHVGFRVHGHVSALKRRVISYLIEQDGRGCDYGLTLPIKIAVPARVIELPVREETGSQIVINALNRILGIKQKELNQKFIDINAINEIISLIGHDLKHDFEKFIGLEKVIESYNQNCLEALKYSVQNIRGELINE